MTNAMILQMQGQVCNPDVMVSPCNVDISPVEWPNQDQDTRASMPAGVCVTSW